MPSRGASCLDSVISDCRCLISYFDVLFFFSNVIIVFGKIIPQYWFRVWMEDIPVGALHLVHLDVMTYVSSFF